jgi:predicted RNA-binding Zn ribbon-like protein
VEVDHLEHEAGTKPAPGELLLVQLFVNTLEMDEDRDEIRGPEELRGWLVEHGLMDARDDLKEADVERAHEVREALRALLLANNGDALDPGAVAALNRAAARAGVLVRFHEGGGAGLEPDASGVDGALGRLLSIVHTAQAEGTWSRLKACREDSCQWAFYDRSKNRSGAWCTMEVCGNRDKARAYRERRRPARR